MTQVNQWVRPGRLINGPGFTPIGVKFSTVGSKSLLFDFILVQINRPHADSIKFHS